MVKAVQRDRRGLLAAESLARLCSFAPWIWAFAILRKLTSHPPRSANVLSEAESQRKGAKGAAQRSEAWPPNRAQRLLAHPGPSRVRVAGASFEGSS